MASPLIIQGPGILLPNRPSGWGYNNALAVPSGLVGYWPFDTDAIISGTTTADFSPSNITGTMMSAVSGPLPPYIDGPVGTALMFDGVANFVDLGTPSTLDFVGSVPFTLSAWINTSGSNFAHIISKGYDGVATQWYLRTDVTGVKIDFGFYPAGALTSTSTIVLNQWELWTGVFSGTALSLYRNGGFDSSTASSGGTHTAEKAAIGAVFAVGSTTQWFGGGLDDVRVYNRALDPGEIMELYVTGLGGLRVSPRRARSTFVPFVPSGTTASGDGASAGVGTAQATGHGIANSVAASAGVGAAAAVGAALDAATAASAGVGTATGVGASTVAGNGVAASIGQATVTGVSAALAASVATSAGTGAAVGVGAELAAGVGASAGTGAAAAIGQSLAAGVAASAGVGAALGVGDSMAAGSAIGASAGASNVLGIGAALWDAIGNAAGTAIVVGVSPSTAQPSGGAGHVIQAHRFTRKRWEELQALIAAEKAAAAKARNVGSPARAKALVEASRKAQDAIFALEDVNGRESYERDMERLRAHLATAAAAKKTADSIREAQAAAILAAQLAAEAQDEQELMLLLDDGPSAARDIERITAMMANLLKR